MNPLKEINDQICQLEKEIEGKHDNGLSGALVEKYIKCGKEGCRCMEGYRHGPYPHIQYYQNGVLKTIYIRKRRGEEYRQKLLANHEFRKKIKTLVVLYKKKLKLEERLHGKR